MEELRNLLGSKVELQRGVIPGGDTLIIRDKKDLECVMRFLRDHTGSQYKSIIDVVGVDMLNSNEVSRRFSVIYVLLSVRYSERLNVKVLLDAEESIESMTSLYRGCDWLEREVYDMFGVMFRNHKDLRRLLTDYGFEGHPLRKDFIPVSP